LIPEILFLVEEICPRTTQINNLRAAISVFLQTCAFETVEGIADTLSSTDDTFVLVIAEGAFVADTDQRCWSNIAVTHWTFAIAFVAKAAYRYAGLLAAHNEISGTLLADDIKKRPWYNSRMMARHGARLDSIRLGIRRGLSKELEDAEAISSKSDNDL
jgi:hypothetical protein